MSENSLKCRNKFFNKVLNKISALKDDFDLLHKVDTKILRKISRNTHTQVGGTVSFVEGQLANLRLKLEIDALKTNMEKNFGTEMQKIINKHTGELNYASDKLIRIHSDSADFNNVRISDTDLELYNHIILVYNIPHDLLPVRIMKSITTKNHTDLILSHNTANPIQDIKKIQNIEVDAKQNIMTFVRDVIDNGLGDLSSRIVEMMDYNMEGDNVKKDGLVQYLTTFYKKIAHAKLTLFPDILSSLIDSYDEQKQEQLRNIMQPHDELLPNKEQIK